MLMVVAKYRVPEKLSSTMHIMCIKRAGEHYEDMLQQDSLAKMADVIWDIINDAHEGWRKQDEIKRLIRGSEECANWLNAEARLALAGGPIWNVWVARFFEYYQSLDLPLNQTLDVTGFGSQMDWMEEISFSQSPLMNSIFVINRRKFVEDKMLSGKGSLFRYMLDQHESGDQNFLYRQTRQIILANGGGAPIDW